MVEMPPLSCLLQSMCEGGQHAVTYRNYASRAYIICTFRQGRIVVEGGGGEGRVVLYLKKMCLRSIIIGFSAGAYVLCVCSIFVMDREDSTR